MKVRPLFYSGKKQFRAWDGRVWYSCLPVFLACLAVLLMQSSSPRVSPSAQGSRPQTAVNVWVSILPIGESGSTFNSYRAPLLASLKRWRRVISPCSAVAKGGKPSSLSISTQSPGAGQRRSHRITTRRETVKVPQPAFLFLDWHDGSGRSSKSHTKDLDPFKGRSQRYTTAEADGRPSLRQMEFSCLVNRRVLAAEDAQVTFRCSTSIPCLVPAKNHNIDPGKRRCSLISKQVRQPKTSCFDGPCYLVTSIARIW